MKILYLECNMGAAGDMLMSALLELHPQPEKFLERLRGLAIPDVTIEKTTEKKCGIAGTHIRVLVHGVEESEHIHAHSHTQEGTSQDDTPGKEHFHEHTNKHSHSYEEVHHSHHHRSMDDIEKIVGNLALSEQVKTDVMAVYRLIAEAEGKAHHCDMKEIHFHEVGTMDAITDIVGVCMLMEELGADEIAASPINVGKGQVTCAHGILPVPAPATAYILRDVPIYMNEISGELCTPTGAALLKHFVSKFTSMPQMRVEKIGYGMGTKDFEAANCVRAFLGNTNDSADEVEELVCNIDDMSGERIGFAVNRLFDGGALDVFTTPIGMKKNRPAVMLTCLCTKDKKEEMIRLLFKHTTTIGIREHSLKRYTLERTQGKVSTAYGDIRVKKSSGYGVTRWKAEYDDIEKIAIENNLQLSEIDLFEMNQPEMNFLESHCSERKTAEDDLNLKNTEEKQEIYDQLERFYDEKSYQEKLEILMPLRGRLTDVMLTNLAISLDIVVQDGSLDDRFSAIVSSLETMKKYQSGRLR